MYAWCIIGESTTGLILLCKGVILDYFEREVFGAQAAFQLSFVGTLIQLFYALSAAFIRVVELFINMRTAFLVGGLLVSGGLAAAGSATQVYKYIYRKSKCYNLWDNNPCICARFGRSFYPLAFALLWEIASSTVYVLFDIILTYSLVA